MSVGCCEISDGFASNTFWYVSISDCKMIGIRSHECHVFLQILLVAIGAYLRQEIHLVLTEFSTFFRELRAQTLSLDVLKLLEG